MAESSASTVNNSATVLVRRAILIRFEDDYLAIIEPLPRICRSLRVALEALDKRCKAIARLGHELPECNPECGNGNHNDEHGQHRGVHKAIGNDGCVPRSEYAGINPGDCSLGTHALARGSESGDRKKRESQYGAQQQEQHKVPANA